MKTKNIYSVVLIADRIKTHSNLDLANQELEFTENEYFLEIAGTLSKIAKKLFIYDDPKEFLNNIKKHKNHVVLSIWSGNNSRNRRALVPSICEAYGIPYVGADTYTSILCQDKSLSKEFCKKAGLLTSKYTLLENTSQIQSIKNVALPFVVKPNLEGGSIGISNTNLIFDYDEGISLVNKLMTLYHQPILVEEFVPGSEISFVVFGNKNKLKLVEAIELSVDKNENFFNNNLFSFEVKKSGKYSILNRKVTDKISKTLLSKIERTFKLLDKVEILRIDGKYFNNDFYFIELTPDIHLGSDCTFAHGFKANNISYEDMLLMIISNCMENIK